MLLRSKSILRRKSAEEDGVGRGGLAGQDAGENGGGAENGADAAGGFAKRKEIKFR